MTWLLLAALIGCPGPPAPAEAPTEPLPSRPLDFELDDALSGLRLRLSDGDPSAGPSAEPIPAAHTTPLSLAQAEALLSRLEPMETQHGDRQVFALRQGSKPPPLSGERVALPFPPPAGPPLQDPGAAEPLRVLRFAPEGEIALAPHLSLSFNQPMVPLSSQDQVASQLPVRLEPQPAGQWRWAGTRTLLFEPDPRFPMATHYTVTVPAGTASASGGSLDAEISWSFTTPALTLKSSWPQNGPQGRQPLIFVGFDQAIDAHAVEPFLSLSHGKQRFATRNASAEEIAADVDVKRLSSAAVDGRWLVRVPTEPLPVGTEFTVTLAQGAPSAEGPRTTPRDQRFQFSTYDPLKVVGHRCSWREQCAPNDVFSVELNNPLDPARFVAEDVQLDPPLPNAQIVPQGRYVQVYGTKKARTTYTLTLPASLRDSFGQALGQDQSVRFEVGPASPTLRGHGGNMVVLDPAGPPSLSIWSAGYKSLDLRIYQVQPKQWGEVGAWWKRRQYDRLTDEPAPSRLLAHRTLEPQGSSDALTETAIDLSPWLTEGHGQLLVQVRAPKLPKRQAEELIQWVQVTDLGLSAMADDQALAAWASDLQRGEAVADASVTLLPSGLSATTDASGLAQLALPSTTQSDDVLVVRRGADVAMLPHNLNWWGSASGWLRRERGDRLSWYVIDDRGLYKPGESVTIQGWLRRWQPGPSGDIAGLDGLTGRVHYRLIGPQGNELLKGTAPLSALGGFHLELRLPDTINLGSAQLHLSAAGGLSGASTLHRIQVQEFRRPEFEVSASVEPGPHLLGEHVRAKLDAHYYAGGGLPAAPVSWIATSSPASFVPPNRDDHRFGTWVPWWRFRSSNTASSEPPQTHQGTTDSTGVHALDLHLQALNPPRPMRVRLDATVQDVNRQAWSSSTSLLVHPAARYVGLKTARSFVEPGDPIDVGVIVVDLDGQAVPSPVSLTMVRLVSRFEAGRWQQLERDAQPCEIDSAADDVSCRFQPEKGGAYRILATVHDAAGRPNQSELRVWVSGGDTVPRRGVGLQAVTLIPDRERYQAGDTARVLVQAPFSPAEALISWRRDGLLQRQRRHLDGPSTTIEVPITEAMVPNLQLQVDLVGEAPRRDDHGQPLPDKPKQVATASGTLNLSIPPLRRSLSVRVTPAAKVLRPGGATQLQLTVRDADGQPVADAELAVIVADESVLALSGYQLRDPLALFYAARGVGVRDYRLRPLVRLGDPEQIMVGGGGRGDGAAAGAGAANGLAMDKADAFRSKASPARRMKSKPGKAEAPRSPAPEPRANLLQGNRLQDDDARAASPIAVRSDFAALALFQPEVHTDADGSASVPLTLPDSLTRYRVMVVAVAGGQAFGKGESTITARNPLMLRPSPPRFLNFGDRVELPLVLQNQTDTPLSVDVALRASNLTLLDALPALGAPLPDSGPSALGLRLMVPANDRVEVRFPVAAQMAGTARVQLAVSSADFADAATVSLPVWTPATSEAFATYGEIDQGGMVQPIQAPPDSYTQFGGLEITTSSTQLQALTDALIYLSEYPFECSEQLASQVMGVATLRDVLDAFEAEQLPSAAELSSGVTHKLDQLASRQNPDGGFPFWRRGDPSWPYLSIHIHHAITRASLKGYTAPDALVRNGDRYLKTIERQVPSWYHETYRRTLFAYALYVRNLRGDNDVARAKQLYRSSGNQDISLEGLGWLLRVLHDGGAKAEAAQIQRYLANRVTETASSAQFDTGYDDQAAYILLASSRRVDAVLLDALIHVDPSSGLIPKLVRGLLAHRKRGRWGNTQENALVLVAMDSYFQAYESVTPDFVARVWLGDGFVGEHAFKGHSGERARIDVPMGYLTELQGVQDITLVKDGPGRLYYRLGLRYAPRELTLAPAERGFSVSRRYEAVDDEADVTLDEHGVWHLRAGSRVRVRLSLVAPARRYHVALVDPLPAGLEVLNPALAVSGPLPAAAPDAVPSGRGRYWWWRRSWYEHENLRDERVEAYTTLLRAGVHRYDYITRATTPGQFVVPPAKAEEMYAPETFGRSGSDRVVVE